jgi:capsular polysaccharide biosynthesis protein
MEFAQLLKTLWDRKAALAVIVALAFAVAVMMMFHVSTHGLKSKSYAYGAAQQQIMIDSPRSSLIDLSQDGAPLASRAAVYAEFMRSNAVVQAIAKRMGVPAASIVAQGPFTTADGTQGIPRPAPARANEVRGEAVQYRLTFDYQQDLPIVSIYAQAPDGASATRLANAAVAGVTDYIHALEQQTNVPAHDQTTVRALGAPVGGTVTAGAKPLMAVLAFIAVFVFGCVLLIAFVSLARMLRQISMEESVEAAGEAEPPTIVPPVIAAEPDPFDDLAAPIEPEPRRSLFRSAVG